MIKEVLSSAEKEREVIFERFAQQLEIVFTAETKRDLFLLAFVEAIHNAAEHGCRKNRTRKIKIRYFLKENFACVSIEDEGSGFDPFFPDPKKVKGARGRGLGFIKANSDLVFFNRKGNKITFLKGVKTMDKTFENVDATISITADQTVIITNLKTTGDRKFALSAGISDILGCLKIKIERFFIDMKHIRILDSLAWGVIFAEAEKEEISLIYLFNSSEAIIKTAAQLGIKDRNDCYSKIKVSANDEEIPEILENIKKTICLAC